MFIVDPFLEIELEGEMYVSFSMAISPINGYSRQFNDVLKGQLQGAKHAGDGGDTNFLPWYY
jgi:hypothetical protein